MTQQTAETLLLAVNMALGFILGSLLGKIVRVLRHHPIGCAVFNRHRRPYGRLVDPPTNGYRCQRCGLFIPTED